MVATSSGPVFNPVTCGVSAPLPGVGLAKAPVSQSQGISGHMALWGSSYLLTCYI